MAEDNKDQHNEDDYQFADLESISGVQENKEEKQEAHEAHEEYSSSFYEAEEKSRNKVIRNALITLVVLGLGLVTYTLVVHRLAENKAAVTPVKLVSVPIQPIAPVEKPFTPPPQRPATPELEQKLNALQLSQDNARSEMNTLSGQLAGITTNISDLSTQVSKLNESIANLSNTVAHQAEELRVLRALEAARTKRVHAQKPRPIYFIRAIIQGRAWIISTKGDTLTIRVGSIVPGYGEVRSIDARLGRVRTRSGRIITFSQEDS